MELKPKEAKKLEKESSELNEDDVLAIQSLQESYTQIKDEIGRIIIGQEDLKKTIINLNKLKQKFRVLGNVTRKTEEPKIKFI